MSVLLGCVVQERALSLIARDERTETKEESRKSRGDVLDDDVAE